MQTNVDPNEINKFDQLAKEWWDPNGPMKALHQINPLRLDYIQQHCKLDSMNVLDVGCGAGILTEALAKQARHATGIDMSDAALQAARQHAEQSQLMIDYQQSTIEAFAEQHPNQFQIITCMEMLEHVPQPEAVIAACASLCSPGGMIFFSTINRNAKAYLKAIVAAEYVLGMIPKGTHEYAKFIRPSELTRWAQQANLELVDLTGMSYNPITQQYRLCKQVDTNYFMCFRKTG